MGGELAWGLGYQKSHMTSEPNFSSQIIRRILFYTKIFISPTKIPDDLFQSHMIGGRKHEPSPRPIQGEYSVTSSLCLRPCNYLTPDLNKCYRRLLQDYLQSIEGVKLTTLNDVSFFGINGKMIVVTNYKFNNFVLCKHCELFNSSSY